MEHSLKNTIHNYIEEAKNSSRSFTPNLYRHKLPFLKTDINLDSDEFLLYIGQVDSILDCTREIIKELDNRDDEIYIFEEVGIKPRFKDSYATGGYFIFHKFPNGNTLGILYYKLTHNPVLNMIIGGHEEMHIPYYFKKYRMIEDYIRELTGKSIDVYRYNAEDLSQVGGLAAVIKNGISIFDKKSEIYGYMDSEYIQNTDKAYDILKDAGGKESIFW